ncbi:MAG TPA: HAMP domain-containing sensor histidine kinase [Acidimicrobiales bacterium]|nr:HAMP domain-containing sensor histidine kinase [Acidimicrobiales bacterium]
MSKRRGTLRWKLALGMTALALATAALVGLFGYLLGGWLGYKPEPVTVTRVEQVGDRIALVQITSQDSTAAAERARRDGVRWMLTAMAASFVPAAALAWLVAGRVLKPVEQVAEVVERVDGTETDERVHLQPRDDELGRLATGVDHMLDRLDARREEQRQLLHEVVHELRTPLAVATTNLELAATDPALSGETETQVSAARRAIDRMGRTVDDLSAHGRLSLQGAETSIDLAKEAHALAAEHAGPASTRGLHIDVVAPGALPAAVDRAAIRGAVGNLLANAVRLAPAGSTITLGCGVRPGWVWIAVRDEGPGIEPAEQPLVFERYWQGRYEVDRRRDAEGNSSAEPHGLGLTIARQLVEAQGGQLTLRSEPGVGTTFVVWLPADPGADAAEVIDPDGIHHVTDPLASPQPV